MAHAAPAAARASTITAVEHGATFTAYFPDDIYGDRASTTTFTIRVEQSHLTERPDGTFLAFHDFPGDIRIYVQVHLTVLPNGTAVVDRDVLKVTGCP